MTDFDDTDDFFGDPAPRRGSAKRAKKARSKNRSEKSEERAAKAAERKAAKEAAAKRKAAEKQARSKGVSKRRSEKLANEFWGEEVIEAPAEGADVYVSKARRAKFERLMLKTTVFVLAPLSLGANVAILGAYMSQEEEPEGVEQTTSPRKSLAVTAVEDYLAGEGSGTDGGDGIEPMPGVELMDWDYVVNTYDAEAVLAEADLDEATLEEELAEAVNYETHFLSLRSTSGTFFTAQVQVAYSETEGAWVTGPPSISAEIPDADDGGGFGGAEAEAFPGLEDFAATESMESAVGTWAEAYYSGSPSLLKQTVGDGREDASYMPMPMADEVEVDITSAVYPPGAEIADEDADLPDIALARVEVTATWPDYDPDQDDEEHPMSGFDDAVEVDDEGNMIESDPDTEETSEEQTGSPEASNSDSDDGDVIEPVEPEFDPEANVVDIPEVEGVEYDPEPGEHGVPAQGLEVTATPEEGYEFDGDDTVTWEFVDDADEADPHVATITYDVLIYDAHTATPRIVAWGAPGEGRDLNEYDNAVEGRILEDAQE